jgi:hypothetical protein
MLEEGCAFEELISFHGGIGGPQTRPFLLYPSRLPLPQEALVGAAAINTVLRQWRALLNGAEAADDDAPSADGRAARTPQRAATEKG